MPAQKKNRFLRILIPLVVIIAGIAIALTQLNRQPLSPPGGQGGSQPAEQTDQQAQQPEEPDTSTPDALQEKPESAPDETEQPALSGVDEAEPIEEAQAETSEPPLASAGLKGLRARAFEAVDATSFASLGGLDDPATENEETPYEFLIELTPLGAGIESITAAKHYQTVERKEHLQIQKRARVQAGSLAVSATALGALAVDINGQFVSLFSRVQPGDSPRSVWREVSPGEFIAEIVNENDELVARVEKTYSLTPGSFDIRVDQRFVNLTDAPMQITWYQYGPIDLAPDYSGYRLDTRRLRFGFIDLSWGPGSNRTTADGDLRSRQSVVDKADNNTPPGQLRQVLLWPDPERFDNAGELVWVAQTGRYFGFSIHTALTPNSTASKALPLAEEVYGVVLGPRGTDDERLIVQLTSGVKSVEAGSSIDLSFAAYAGPLGRSQLVTNTGPDADPMLPVYKALSLNELVIYNIGGMCAFCTFQPLARGLLAFLHLVHDYLVFDWAIAIMILVLVVRTILHPITKRSQISLARFSKQMQRIAPKQKKIQEKYRDDRQRMQQEMARLMREEGVNYAGALGCLPMFLQTPIWIALYAMLYFAFELRHEAAYFGIFQKLTGGNWEFLADLSTADHFIPLPFDIHIPLVSNLMGAITAINLLPLLLGVVFYLQQKYLTPPTSASLTPEQQQQQKIMKVMMVVMFPVFMYNAPAGLSIYFITNSTLAILESRWIRSHIDQLDIEKPKKHEPLGKKKVRNTAKGPGNPFKKDRTPRKRFKDRS